NSQSGKGGVAYIMKEEHHLDLPRRLQIELSGVIQRHTDTVGGEVSPEQMWNIFAGEYLTNHQRERVLVVDRYSTSTVDGKVEISATADVAGVRHELAGVGNGPIDAFTHALEAVGYRVRVLDYAEHALSAGEDARA